MSWLFQAKISKSHFYVWYLGSKEADGVRGSAVVLPIMRQLLKDSFKKTPSKATVQGFCSVTVRNPEEQKMIQTCSRACSKISSKGLKLTQSVPAMSRSGKIKTQLAKFQIAASCITYSMTGKAPFDDVVGVVMLVLNPEMNSPMHVHCYRCDSPETAQIMHANIQLLISRPEIQRSILDLEQRLFLAGLLVPRSKPGARSASRPRNTGTRAVSDDFAHPAPREDRTRIFTSENTSKARPGRQNMPKRVVDELKSKLTNNDLRLLQNSFQSMGIRGDTAFAGRHTKPQFRMFGDTMLREGKSRSLDNLGNIVSTDLRGGDNSSNHRFSRLDMPRKFGQSEDFEKSDGLWKPKVVRRVSSIRMNL